MSRRQRQDAQPETAPEPEGGTASKAGNENMTDGVSSPEAPEPTSDAKPRTGKLPAFGFAADFLADRQRPVASSQAASSKAKPQAEDIGAIFAFADTLTAAEKDEERRVAEARITTWITFDLADEKFALPVEPVREVLRIHKITRVPHAPYPIRGVTNLRGRVIPVIDLRRRVGLREGELGRLARIIIVASRGRLIGLLVDQVHQVMHLDLNLVQQPPDDVMTFQSDYISGVYHLGEELLLLLDIDRALTLREPSEAQISGAA